MNKATLLVAELKKLIKPLQGVVNSTSVLPVLECVFIEFEDDVMKVTVTDLETVVIAKMTIAKVNKPFCFCVDFKLFKSLIDKCECENLSLELKTGRILFNSVEPEFTLELPTEDPANFPKITVIENSDFYFAIKAPEVVPHLKVANLFSSNDDLRPAMTGVLMMNYENHLTFVATDAHRLYKKKLNKITDNGIKAGKQYILPQKSVKVLGTLFKDQIVVRGNDVHTEFFDDTYKIIMRNIDARYPDWTAVWPKQLTCSFYCIRKNFRSALELASQFSNKSTGQVKFILSEHHTQLYTGDADFSIDFQYKLAVYENIMPVSSFSFALNSKFMKEAVGITKDVNIRIRYESATKAFIIDDDILIMPLMINE